VAGLARRIQKLLKGRDAKLKVNGIGLVVPGMVDATSGRILNAPQLGWRDVDVRDALEKATGLSVHVENAPIACALAQMWLGDGDVETPRDFVYLTVGDGVGTRGAVNGQGTRGRQHTRG